MSIECAAVYGNLQRLAMHGTTQRCGIRHLPNGGELHALQAAAMSSFQLNELRPILRLGAVNPFLAPFSPG